MRKLGSLLVLGTLAFVVGCSDDGEDVPSPIAPVTPVELLTADIRLDENSGDVTEMATVAADSTAKVRVTFVDGSDAAKNIRRVYITQNIAGTGEEKFDVSVLGSGIDTKGDGSIDVENKTSDSVVYEFNLPVPSALGSGGTAVYKFWSTSGKGDFRNSDKRLAIGVGTLTLKVGNGENTAMVKSYTDLQLNAPLNDGSSNSFISTLDGAIYKINQGEEFVAFWDFGYFYGATGLASFASTENYPSSVINIATVANTTSEDTFNKVYFAESTKTAADFTAVSTSGDLNSITASTEQRVTQMNEGDVIEFVDNYGKKGLIMIKEIEPGNGSGDFVKFDMKVQP